jgi:cation transport regulator ChaC
MVWYFAYGSNMDPERMGRLAPSASVEGPASLPSHRFVVTPDGYGSVLPDPAGTVYGVVWRLTGADEQALDAYEGVQEGLYRKTFRTVQPRSGGRPFEALIYISRDQRSGIPQPGYLESVVHAARRHGLPTEYVAELERWLPGKGA